MKITEIVLGAFCFLIMSSMTLKAQSTPILKLLIVCEDNEPISKPELLIEQNDSTILFSYLDEREKSVPLPAIGQYRIIVSALGYLPFDQTLDIKSDTTLNISMEPKVTQLDEVVITAKSPSKVTATGEVFKLSQKSKALKDPFRALSEIPALSVDIIGQSITTRDGQKPLILIDGRLVNTGISPILPSDIESVEVSEIVTARYLEQGYTKVVNIRLRPDRPLYTYIDARTRHDVPFRQGFAGGNFEFGRSKFAVYGSLFYEYLHNDRTSVKWEEHMDNLAKIREGVQSARFNEVNGDINLKWLPSKDDYFAARFVFKKKTNQSDSHQIGTLSLDNQPIQQSPLSVSQNDRQTDNGILGALFYQHTFKDQSTLDLYAHYNRGTADFYKSTDELWEKERSTTHIGLNSIRNQYTFNADYASGSHSFGSFELGNHLVHTDDQILNVESGPFVKESILQLSNYTFATYQQRWHRFMLMTSVGIQGLFVKASDRKSSYFRPRTSESLVYVIDDKQAIRLSHVLTNSLPSSMQLGTFSTSSNPLLREEGNIHLRPNQKNVLGLSYELSLDKMRLSLSSDQTWIRDIIEPYIYMDGEQYVRSYRNNGTYRCFTFGPLISFQHNNITAMLGSNVMLEHFNEQPKQWSWQVDGNLIWWMKDNLGLTASIKYMPKSYTSISVTHFKNPSVADISLAWYPTDNIQISIGIPYFWGVREQYSIINSAGYYQKVTQQFTSSSLRPFILFSYTLRKHSKLQIRSLMPEGAL